MRRHLSIALLLVVALVAACIPSAPSQSADASRAPAVSAGSSAETQPSTSEEPTSSTAVEQPTASAAATAEPTPAPTETATPSDAAAGASPSTGTGPAAVCSGTDNNRTFFEEATLAVNWTVYCAVLPTGWFVDSGQYRGSGGGRVEISYKGPGGARLELHEGAFCAAADGCVPAGTDAGETAFGERTGTLVTLDSGGWAVVVDRGKSISWLAVGTGLSQAAFQTIASGLATVGG